jgi:transposase-like protein
MAKPGRPSPGLDDYLYWQESLTGRDASGLSIDEFCVDEGVSRSTFYRWVRRLKDGIPDAVREEGGFRVHTIKVFGRLAMAPYKRWQ